MPKYSGREVHLKNDERVAMASEIFEQYGNLIFSFFLSHTGNEGDAEDLFQEFFISLVQKPIPQDIQNIKSYIYRAVRNDFLDSIRRDKNYQSRINVYTELKVYKTIHRNAEDIVGEKEEAENIIEFIQENLPLHESTSIIGRYYHGKNNKEASDEMGIDRRSVSRYISVGLKKIRKVLR